MHPTMNQAQTPPTSSWVMLHSDSVFQPYRLVAPIFYQEQHDPVHDQRATQLLYLFRRFGYPRSGWDPERNVVTYLLTTPDPEIALWVKPAASIDHAFGYAMEAESKWQAEDTELSMRCIHREKKWEEHPWYQRIHHAITASMRELLRPVYIDNTCIVNILGRVRPQHSAWNLDRASYSSQAGHGVSNEYTVIQDSEIE